MNRRDILHRLAGVVVLLGAGASTLVHREVWRDHASGPASGLEAALGLLTFGLASFGILLFIGGARLRDGWKRECDRTACHHEKRIQTNRNSLDEAEYRRIITEAVDSMAFPGGRAQIAAFLIMRARLAALDASLSTNTSAESLKPRHRSDRALFASRDSEHSPRNVAEAVEAADEDWACRAKGRPSSG